MKLDIVFVGLTITSSWGNGHATTYRALAKALSERGHDVTFLERDVPWYREHRDLPEPPYCRVELYETLREFPARHARLIADANLVVLGSYVPDGAALGDWITMQARGVTAFYDIDTPVTLAGLQSGKVEYLNTGLIPRFDLYLSFTGGPVLEKIEQAYGSPCARPLYCAVDPDIHSPVDVGPRWQLGYLGTYSKDRQRALQELLIKPARRLGNRKFVVAGPQYPASMRWPANVERIEHLAPDEHSTFYCAQQYTLNITRADMVAAGYSPSVRLFEAAACGVPIISDRWPGLETLLTPEREILIADSAEQITKILCEIPEERRLGLAAAARNRVLREHTAQHRAKALEEYYREVLDRDRVKKPVEAVA
jgi:spore maturation protein CgeB